jgi:hypothetical protein
MFQPLMDAWFRIFDFLSLVKERLPRNFLKKEDPLQMSEGGYPNP